MNKSHDVNNAILQLIVKVKSAFQKNRKFKRKLLVCSYRMNDKREVYLLIHSLITLLKEDVNLLLVLQQKTIFSKLRDSIVLIKFVVFSAHRFL